MSADYASFIMDVETCPRCAQPHPGVEFRRLRRPVALGAQAAITSLGQTMTGQALADPGRLEFHAVCPKDSEPILAGMKLVLR